MYFFKESIPTPLHIYDIFNKILFYFFATHLQTIHRQQIQLTR